MSLSHLSARAGDPTVFGWAVFGLYFVAAVSCYRRIVKNPKLDPSERHVWTAIAIACVLLGLNKQLDLQTVLIEQARRGAHALNLYEYKRVFQYGFLLMVSVGLVALGIVVARKIRSVSTAARVAALGLGIVLLYVLLRASRFQRVGVDSILGDSLDGLVELSGLIVVAGAGLWGIISGRSKVA